MSFSGGRDDGSGFLRRPPCVLLCVRICAGQLNNCSVGDKKMADAFGSTL